MATKRTNILLMIDDASMGGGQQHVLWLAERLPVERYDVAVACAASGYLVDELAKRGIKQFPVAMTNRISLSTLMSCRTIYRTFKPDIIHTHGGTAGFAGRVAALFRRRTRMVHTYHGIHYLHYQDRLRRVGFTLADRLMLRWTDLTICVAQADYELGVKAGVVDPARAVVIRNGIDVSRFENAAVTRQGKNVVIGTVGRLHTQKGHTFLLRAVREIFPRYPACLLRIVGDGELRARLEEESVELGIRDRVEFMGEKSDIPTVLSGMDMFVLSSLWEGLPLVLLEAMAAEKPIVSTAVDGVLEVLRDGENAVLVQPGNAEDLARGIARLLEDSAMAGRLAKQGRADVKSMFGIERMVRETEEAYQRVLS